MGSICLATGCCCSAANRIEEIFFDLKSLVVSGGSEVADALDGGFGIGKCFGLVVFVDFEEL